MTRNSPDTLLQFSRNGATPSQPNNLEAPAMADRKRSDRPRGARYRNLTRRGNGIIYYQRRVRGKTYFLSTEERDWDDAVVIRDGYERDKDLVDLGPIRSNEPPSPTFAEVTKLYFVYLDNRAQKGDVKHSTRDGHIAALRPEGRVAQRFGRRPIASITRTDVTRWWLEEVESRPIRQQTGLNTLNAISKLFQHAVAAGLLKENPCAGIRAHLDLRARAVDPRPIEDPQQLAALVDYFASRAAAYQGRARENDFPRMHMLVLLLAHCGLRLGEAMGLPWSCVDLEHGTLEVRWNLSRQRYLEPLPKNRKPRPADLSSQLVDLLRREKLARSKQLGVLHLDKITPALTREGEKAFVARVGEGHFRRHFAEAKKAAGITDPRITPHALRHTYASYLLSDGRPIAEVADAIGDTVMVTQTRYAKYIRRRRNGPSLGDHIARMMTNAAST